MYKKLYLVSLMFLVAGTAFLLQACDSASDKHLPTGGTNSSVAAILVGSPGAVVSGPPGAYYISEDGKKFHLRCPGGNCTKSAILSLEPGSSAYVWSLSGEPGKPTLSPSIHWFETDGVTTHWHGWLRDGYFVK